MSPLLLWAGFALVVIALLTLDLGVFHRKAHVVGLKEALTWSAVWILLALLFNLGVYVWGGAETALEFLTGYLLEKVLSIDMIFVFMLIFGYFRVPARYQHTVLFWGIIGALIMRIVLIAAGITLIQVFHWLNYAFGAFLILTGIKMSLQKGQAIRPERSPMVRVLRRVMPVTEEYHGARFFVEQGGRRLATPLFVALLIIETTDFVFAIDSIPAVLAITSDPFVVYTSNVFALLGLRALYFAVAGIVPVFHHLHYGFAAILTFAGLKMALAGFYEMPVELALGVIGGILFVAMLASMVKPRDAQIIALMDQGSQAGTFQEGERKLVERVLRFGDQRVGQIMVPRTQVVWLDLDDSIEKVRRTIDESGHSRFPVGTGSLDRVVGLVHVKDLLVQSLTGPTVDVRAALRAALFVPEHMHALKVLESFKQNRSHLAVVVDEHGVTQGVVTLHDMLEAIAGDLPTLDQPDTREPRAVRDSDGTWRVDGGLAMARLREALGLGGRPGEEPGAYETVGGFMMMHLDRMPSVGDGFEHDGLRLEVAAMDGPRVDKVTITPIGRDSLGPVEPRVND
jgi:tellurite resistance protein TerC